MAALPYIQLYVADYLADTAHLSTEEHGAYLLLIMNYWQRGKALPNDDKRLALITRLPNERWTDVKQTLNEFFNITPTEWQHARIERDLENVRIKSTKAALAGKASYEARMAKKGQVTEQNDSERSTDVPTDVKQTSDERINHTDTDTDTDTDSVLNIIAPKKSSNQKNKLFTMLYAYGIYESLANDFINHRKIKKSAINETVMDGFKRESELAGISVCDAVKISIERGWTGFKAEWVQPRTSSKQPSTEKPKYVYTPSKVAINDMKEISGERLF